MKKTTGDEKGMRGGESIHAGEPHVLGPVLISPRLGSKGSEKTAALVGRLPLSSLC